MEAKKPQNKIYHFARLMRINAPVLPRPLMDICRNQTGIPDPNSGLSSPTPSLRMESSCHERNLRVYVYVNGRNKHQSSNTIEIDEEHRELTFLNCLKRDGRKAPTPRMFQFDGVFNEDSQINEICSQILTDLVRTVVFEGRTSSLISIGHTQTGKTRNMIGNDETHCTTGIIPTAIAWLYRLVRCRNEDLASKEKLTVKISSCEMNPETGVILDLLQSKCNKDSSQNLWCNSENDAGYFVNEHFKNLRQIQVISVDQAANFLDEALRNRSSYLNHFLFILNVFKVVDETQESAGSLRLVDLTSCDHVEGKLHDGVSISAHLSILYALTRNSPTLPFCRSKISHFLDKAVGSLPDDSVPIIVLLFHLSNQEDNFHQSFRITQKAYKFKCFAKKDEKEVTPPPEGAGELLYRIPYSESRSESFVELDCSSLISDDVLALGNDPIVESSINLLQNQSLIHSSDRPQSPSVDNLGPRGLADGSVDPKEDAYGGSGSSSSVAKSARLRQLQQWNKIDLPPAMSRVILGMDTDLLPIGLDDNSRFERCSSCPREIASSKKQSKNRPSWLKPSLVRKGKQLVKIKDSETWIDGPKAIIQSANKIVSRAQKSILNVPEKMEEQRTTGKHSKSLERRASKHRTDSKHGGKMRQENNNPENLNRVAAWIYSIGSKDLDLEQKIVSTSRLRSTSDSRDIPDLNTHKSSKNSAEVTPISTVATRIRRPIELNSVVCEEEEDLKDMTEELRKMCLALAAKPGEPMLLNAHYSPHVPVAKNPLESPNTCTRKHQQLMTQSQNSSPVHKASCSVNACSNGSLPRRRPMKSSFSPHEMLQMAANEEKIISQTKVPNNGKCYPLGYLTLPISKLLSSGKTQKSKEDIKVDVTLKDTTSPSQQTVILGSKNSECSSGVYDCSAISDPPKNCDSNISIEVKNTVISRSPAIALHQEIQNVITRSPKTERAYEPDWRYGVIVPRRSSISGALYGDRTTVTSDLSESECSYQPAMRKFSEHPSQTPRCVTPNGLSRGPNLLAELKTQVGGTIFPLKPQSPNLHRHMMPNNPTRLPSASSPLCSQRRLPPQQTFNLIQDMNPYKGSMR